MRRDLGLIEHVAICYGVAAGLKKEWPLHGEALGAVLKRFSEQETKIEELEQWAVVVRERNRRIDELMSEIVAAYDGWDTRELSETKAMIRLRRLSKLVRREIAGHCA